MKKQTVEPFTPESHEYISERVNAALRYIIPTVAEQAQTSVLTILTGVIIGCINDLERLDRETTQEYLRALADSLTDDPQQAEHAAQNIQEALQQFVDAINAAQPQSH